MDLDVQDTNKLVDGIKIPPAPYILNELHGEMQKDSPELQVIADIISKDVGISSLILRTVNSSFFAFQGAIDPACHQPARYRFHHQHRCRPRAASEF